jgi:hypothetical protein
MRVLIGFLAVVNEPLVIEVEAHQTGVDRVAVENRVEEPIGKRVEFRNSPPELRRWAAITAR